MIRIFVAVLMSMMAVSCAQQVTPTQSSRLALSHQAALDLLRTQLQRDSVYSAWARIECLSFITEDSTSEYFGMAVRERHGGGCPGDTSTFPLVDRFRVKRLSPHRILWWNVSSESDDDYEPWEKFVANRK